MNTWREWVCGRWRGRRRNNRSKAGEIPNPKLQPQRIPSSNIQKFKDHFSKHAADYAKYRPRYPKELFQWLGAVAPAKDLAWDCATGNGQAAVELAEVFERVIATDASKTQIANAERHLRVKYRVATAEASGLEPQSVDLVTVAQALHWFDLERFETEARRVLKPGGIVVAWAYKLATVSPAIDAVVNHYYSEVVGPYWPPERGLVEKFEDLPFGFEQIAPPSFEMRTEWSFGHLLGYLRTWSATQRFLAAEKRDPLEDVEEELRRAWGDEPRRVLWPLTVKAGKV